MDNLNQKLELLHLCLIKENIPKEIPHGLEEFQKDFDIFREVAEGCMSSCEEKFTQALSKFRDVLLGL
jgi:hypothetical protein